MNAEFRSDEYIEFEEKKWNDYYDKALKGEGQEHQRSLWWDIMDADTVDIVLKHLPKKSGLKILEPGCGSGAASFCLAKHLENCQVTLCDISNNALRFARQKEPTYLKNDVTYQLAEVSQMPFEDETFDLTWNVGVIEHYPLDRIEKMVAEMLRVTKKEGLVIVAIPNRNSIAVKKAWLLGTDWGRKFLKFIPGYRFDTEIPYKNKTLNNFLRQKSKKKVIIEYAGNSLWVGAPTFLVRLTNRFYSQSSFSFLTFFILKQ